MLRATGGALLARLPVGPTLNLPPALVLALLVTPVVLDAAYGTSLRGLRDNRGRRWPAWGFAAIGLTTATVAWVALGPGPLLPPDRRAAGLDRDGKHTIDDSLAFRTAICCNSAIKTPCFNDLPGAFE